MPRILLLVDEFQEFFTVDDQASVQAAQILDRLVRQGRAFGLHVLLGSQTLAGAYTLARSTMDQMGVRIALQCTDADSRLILADDNPAARLLSRPGDAIYNDHNGLVEGNSRFQVAILEDADEQKYLAQLQALAGQKRYPQTVFEGSALGAIGDNVELRDMIFQPGWPSAGPIEQAWLGEPISIAPHVSAKFRRQSGSNLLIVGQNEEAALGMLTTSLVSLAAQHHPEQSEPNSARFMVIDYSPVDGQYATYLPEIIAQLPHAQQTMGIIPRRRLDESLTNLVAEIQQRLAREDQLSNGVSASQDRPGSIYLVIYGLQRARDLRPDDMMGMPTFNASGIPEPPSAAQLFSTILRDGPEVGVHTLVWCDTVTNLSRSLDRRALREFSMRAAFQMSAEDSATVLDSPAASRLGTFRALYVSEDEGIMETFRPYGLPPTKWLTPNTEALRAKVGSRQQITPPTP
jgi:hypothetical protein